MSGIFLSYRRHDSAGWAGRLYEHLVREWGPDRVFIDIDAIAPGDDFREAIARTMHTCDVVIVVIGPNWISARDQAGNRRLDDESDTHRQEVAAALAAADVRVIPVLVGGASMPTLSELPGPLQELRYRNAAIIEDRRFGSDARDLLDALREFAENLAAQRADEEAKRAAEQQAAQRAVRDTAPQSSERLPPPSSPPREAVSWAGGPDIREQLGVSWGSRFGAALIDGMILAFLFVPAFGTGDVAVANVLAAVALAGWVALGIRVVDLRTGGPIGHPRAAVRALLLVALLFLCWLFLIVEFFRRNPQQLLHDSAVGSIVVKT
jgi:TIR domain